MLSNILSLIYCIPELRNYKDSFSALSLHAGLLEFGHDLGVDGIGQLFHIDPEVPVGIDVIKQAVRPGFFMKKSWGDTRTRMATWPSDTNATGNGDDRRKQKQKQKQKHTHTHTAPTPTPTPTPQCGLLHLCLACRDPAFHCGGRAMRRGRRGQGRESAAFERGGGVSVTPRDSRKGRAWSQWGEGGGLMVTLRQQDSGLRVRRERDMAASGQGYTYTRRNDR